MSLDTTDSEERELWWPQNTFVHEDKTCSPVESGFYGIVVAEFSEQPRQESEMRGFRGEILGGVGQLPWKHVLIFLLNGSD